jgi:thymidylate synthase (FAD)
VEVKLVSLTTVDKNYVKHLLENIGIPEEYEEIIQNPEGLMAYIARVSSPNQTNSKYAGLIKYCMTHGHWSVLETCNAVFEIETSRAIAAQILRHRSFSFQEFSQRYAAVDDSGIEIYEARRQDDKNRQNSIDDLGDDVKVMWQQRQRDNWRASFDHYQWALSNGIAKECARMVLPLQVKTKLFANGTIRSWVHYLNSRTNVAAQKEHRDVAEAIKSIFISEFPIISEAAGWAEATKVAVIPS